MKYHLRSFPQAARATVALLLTVAYYASAVAEEQDRIVTDFEEPMVQFSYMAWEQSVQASDGLLSIRADGSYGGFGLNVHFDLSDLAEYSPAIVLTVGPHDASIGLNILLRDENDASAAFHFPLGDVVRGRRIRLTPRDGASFAMPNGRGKDGKVIDLAKIKQIQVLGEWKGNKPIDVVVDKILAVAPNKEILAARGALQLRPQREAEKAKLQLLERRRRIAEARKSIRHGDSCAEVVHVGAIDQDILAIEIQDGAYVPSRIEEYTEMSDDQITEKKNKKTGEISAVLLKREGVEVVEFVTGDRSHIRYHDGVEGEPLVWELIGDAAAYAICSSDDPAYAQAVTPLKVSRKCKPTAWAHGNRQPTRHYAYLHLPSGLKAGATYTITFVAVSTRQPQVNFKHDPDRIRSEAIHVNQVGYLTGRKLHGIWGGYHDAGDWDMHCDAGDWDMHCGHFLAKGTHGAVGVVPRFLRSGRAQHTGVR
jgi:hypothetical protein